MKETTENIAPWLTTIINYQKEQQLGILRFECEFTLPTYSILHYMERITSDLLKIQIITKLIDFINLDIPLACFYIKKRLKALVPQNISENEVVCININEIKQDEYVCLIDKGEQNKVFFDYLFSTQRPDVYILIGDSLYPLYDIHQPDAIHLKKISINSPFLSETIGALPPLIETYDSIKDISRKQILFESQLTNNTLSSLNQLADLEHKMNTYKLSPGINAYLNEMTKSLIYKINQNTEILHVKKISISEYA